MATYTVTGFTVDQRHPVPLSNSPFAIASGTITINPYSQTRLAVPQITGLFKTSGLLRVKFGADPLVANTAYWDSTNKSVFVVVIATGLQAAEGLTTIGALPWMAIGQMG